jgi:NADH-quinone oxidoreductase subunit M
MGIFFKNFWLSFFSSTSMILGAVYTLWTYNRLFFGNIKESSICFYKDLKKKEFYLLFFLLISLFWMGIYPLFLLQKTVLDCVNVLLHTQI